MSFHIGQKIVCICDDWQPAPPPCFRFPKKDAIYTVRLIGGFPDYAGTFLRVVEIINPGPFEPAFSVHFFRPLVERKTDITVFEQLLTPTKPKQLVDA